MHTGSKRLCTCLLVLGCLISSMNIHVYASEDMYGLEESYGNVYDAWKKANIEEVDDVSIVASPNDASSNASLQKEEGKEGFAMSKDSYATYKIDVAKRGLYELSFEYMSLSEGLIPIQAKMKVNGSVPYAQANRVLYHPLWKDDVEEFETDRKGNEIEPGQTLVKKWQTTTFNDPLGIEKEPLKILLEEGMNEITFEHQSGEVLLGSIQLHSHVTLSNYEQYRSFTAEEIGQGLQVFEAEKVSYKNSFDIYPYSDRNMEVFPYDSRIQHLNTLGIGSPQTSVSYELDVEKSGYYQVAFKVQQEQVKNAFVYYDILIDGKIPFQEAQAFAFPETDGYETIELKEEIPYQIYLEKGTHILSMRPNASVQGQLMKLLDKQNKTINEMSLDIKKIIGNNADPNRDWDMLQYMPTLSTDLQDMAKSLDEEVNKAKDIYKVEKDIESLNKCIQAIEKLRELAESPNTIPNNLSKLSEGSGSASQLLSDANSLLKMQTLDIDQIYLYGTEDTLPDYDVNFFEQALESGKLFLNSFQSDDEVAYEEDEVVLDIWVNRNQSMVNMMQKFADEKFSKEQGIHVNFSMMPNEQKLILSNTSDEQPDIALGVSTTIPYEFAIRNAALDLRQFEGFEEVSKRFSPGAFLSYTNDGGVYALPETQDFYVTFYRKDILDTYNIPVPNTWEEVISILPELQRSAMNYYIPLASTSGSKPFMFTAPFIYQNGGDIYNQETMQVALDEEASVDGIKLMSDLITIYGMPQQVPSFYNHFRSGTLPIGIASMADYLKLLKAAPEIAGAWDIALYPGIENEAGEVQRWAPGSAQAAMAFAESEYPQECWEFLKWWTSEDIQSEFAFQLQNIYGSEYLWGSANLNAFAQLPIEEKHKETILKQWEYLKEVPKVPGGYVVEREISNIYNRIVFDGENPRASIDQALITMNKEITRKLEEFGYMEDGVLVKPYHIPAIEEIEAWGE